MNTKPRLRWPIKIDLHKSQQPPILILSCPLGISPAPLALHAATGPLLDLMRGDLTISEIVSKCSHIGATSEIVEEIVKALDSNLLLENENFATRALEIRQTFNECRIRPAALAGLAYPKEPEDLKKEVNSYLETTEAEGRKEEKRVIGLISPHIDYRRGHKTYGAAWRHVIQEQPEIFIVLGTSHQYSETLFLLSRKEFSSPLGTHRNDLEILSSIEESYGKERSYTSEFLHKQEHSIELQLPFITTINSNSIVVPILVGSFHEMIGSGKYPDEIQEYQDFINGLVNAVRKLQLNNRRFCIVGGIDMAHVGPVFGDKSPLSKEQMQLVAHEDMNYISAIESQDKGALFRNIAKDGDARRVCGYPSAYTMIDLFDRLGIKYSATLHDYRQSVDFEGGCAVTFAGMSLHI